MQAIASFLRRINANLITVRNPVLEKVYKFFFAASLMLYKNVGDKIKYAQVTVIENFDGDLKMKIDTSRTMGAAIYWTGFHEFREFIYLHQYLKKDMVFVDIGANQGEYTLFAAKRLTSGRVLSFEPLPSMLKTLTENISLNKFRNIELFEFGLSDEERMLTIHEFEGSHEGLATLYPGEKKIKSSLTIPLTTLDNVFDSTKLQRLDFIKIDIEGGELNALKGAKKTIELFKPYVLIEINAETYKAAGYTIHDIGDFFRSIKYRSFEIAKRGHLVDCLNLPQYGNIVFKPQ